MSRLIEKNSMLGFSDLSSNFIVLKNLWFLSLSIRSLSEEDSKDRFEDSDEDMDGLVTWAEYKAEEYDFNEEEVDLEDPEMAEEWKLMEEDR